MQLPATLPVVLPTSNTDTDTTSSTASESPANGAAILVATSAAANGARGSADPTTMAQVSLTGLPATKDTKVNTADTPMSPTTALSDSGTLA